MLLEVGAAAGDDRTSPWGLVLPLVLLAVVYAYGRWQSGRRLGGQRQIGLLRKSLKSGRIAEGADRDRWRAALARNAPRRLRSGRWISIVLVVYVVLGLLMFARILLAANLLAAIVVILPFFVFGPILVYIQRVVSPRSLRRIEVLERELSTDD